MEVLPGGPVLTHHISDLGAGTCRHLAALAAGSAGLEAALEVLDAALPVAASPLLKLAVLLSTASAGTGSTDLGPAPGGGQGEECDDAEAQVLLQRRRSGSLSRNQVCSVAGGARAG